MMQNFIRFWLQNPLLVTIAVLMIVLGGVMVAPFDWHISHLERRPIAVDAIPDISENQQIVFTEWPGRSPQDIDDQVTYPLTVSLLGLPGVKSVRSYSNFGFSMIYVIFKDDVEFYWSRSRILEKLNSLPAGTLPASVTPSLGPDATALGQVFWYTLEGRDPGGNPTGGWGLEELRSVQDWLVRYALTSASGVAEVASIGGFVKEYQVDVDPDAMRAYGVGINQIFDAIKAGNLDVGARTIEVNRAEYLIRGVGFIEKVEDIENIAVLSRDNVPVFIRDVAHVALGPAQRRGVLDKGGVEVVGGVVVVRFGDNPLQAIQNIKRKIDEIAPGLPSKTLDDGTRSQITIVPFYDRTGLIYETLDTLNDAIIQQVLVTILVVIVLVVNLRMSLLISATLPLTVLATFLLMKVFDVDANIVALSGIAIAVGTIVDMGIVLCENIVRHLHANPQQPRFTTILNASQEVAGAVLTAVLTTIIGFLPVFTMTGAEGKLFAPLAYTKTFALTASIIIAIVILPVMAHGMFRTASAVDTGSPRWRRIIAGALALLVVIALADAWQPLGPAAGIFGNAVLVIILIGLVLLPLFLLQHYYTPMLDWCLRHKAVVLVIPTVLIALGITIWLGFATAFSWLPGSLSQGTTVNRIFPGLGKEFMPALNEGSFLYMPTTMPHASLAEATDVLQKLDLAIASIPEVDTVVGKLGRADSALDSAPISMIETVIQYKPEFHRDEDGNWVRQWRDHIRNPDDIWREIIKATQLPGTTSAPKLQPIETRIIMLQSGFRAPMGIKVYGPDLPTIEAFGLALEQHLRQIPGVKPETVFAERIEGKPYLEIRIDRERIARYGIPLQAVQSVIEVAIGGKPVTTTVEGRERYPVRVRYLRELRDHLEALDDILIPASDGKQIPLRELATIAYVKGPQMIKSEDTFLVGYVIFDKAAGEAETTLVERAQSYLDDKIRAGELVVPAGVKFRFAGNYENQVRANKTLALVVPIALLVIFTLLYLQFRSVYLSVQVFSGVFIAWSGGFVLLWLYGQGWFMNFSLLGMNLRDLFNMGPMNLSIAVWVGFLALFGIATDDGVIMGTRLQQVFRERQPDSVADIRAATLAAAQLRIKACVMTSATTIIALLPVLSASGRGADIMVPMAIPSVGGMLAVLLSLFVVPTLYCLHKEWRLKRRAA